MSTTAPQRHSKSVSEVVNVAVDMRGILDEGELLTGTPTIIEVATNVLTLSNKAINTEALVINSETVAIGEAVQFSVAGGVAGSTYTIRITVVTDSTPAQTRIVRLKIAVVAD